MPKASNVRLLDVIREAAFLLSSAGVLDPELSALFAVSQSLGIKAEEIDEQRDRLLTEDETARIRAIIERRKRRETFSRIKGVSEFWGLPFGLNEATLEPREDSERVVRVALDLIKEKPKPRVLDLGTGTGCLLLALLHELRTATGLGIDLAPRAVEQAQQNAEALGLADRATFRIGNWTEGIDEKFDLIVCNPPYVKHSDIPTLMRAVRDFDPVLALDGGENGLQPYVLLAPRLPSLLTPGGVVVFEVGWEQAKAVAALMEKSGFKDIFIHNDTHGIERCVAAHGEGRNDEGT